MTAALWPPRPDEDALRIHRPAPWTEFAACQYTDGDLWFPEKGGSVRAAKRICGGCAVRAECLAYALENDEQFGVWGGLSERERNGSRPRASARPPGRRPGYCGNDLHVMDEANTSPGRRCLACKRERKARETAARAGLKEAA